MRDRPSPRHICGRLIHSLIHAAPSRCWRWTMAPCITPFRPATWLAMATMTEGITGFCFCGMVDDPPALGRRTSPSPVWVISPRSSAILARVPVTRVIHAASPAMGWRAECQLCPGSDRPRPLAKPARTAGPLSSIADSVPAAPERLTFNRLALTTASWFRSSISGLPQLANTAPKVVGVATWP